VPLFALVILMMVAGGWAALQRAGIPLPSLSPALIGMHGPLMIGGVFGALIALERAVAISALLKTPLHWSFLAPFFAGAGGILLIVTGVSPAAKTCLILGSLLLVAIYIHTATVRRFWSLHTALMSLGAGILLVGNLAWASGLPAPAVVHAWLGFLVLTIVGERLELSRVLRLTGTTERLLLGATLVYTLGVLLSLIDLALGARIAGVGAILVGGWLLRFDIAGRLLRQQGLTRYIATCLFVGYLWLMVYGGLAILFGAVYGGLQYDAIVHALVVGFLFSMVFGHAPLILPALTGRQVAFTPLLYQPLALLHLSLVLRQISDLSGAFGGRMWASAINAVAVLLFAGIIARQALRQSRPA
jgi:hypothetical protein